MSTLAPPAKTAVATSEQPQVLPTLATTLLALLMLEIVTGIVLYLFFVPTAQSAYGSVSHIQLSKVLAWVRAVHHWTSATAIVIGALTLVVGVLEGGYRAPHRMRWVATVIAVILVMLFQLTGHGLPWDTQAVKTAVVETGIANGSPVAGAQLAAFLRGGHAVGPGTLDVWFRGHAYFLPIALVLFVLLPIGLAKQTGRAACGFSIVVMLVLLVVSALLGAPALGSPSTPADLTGAGQVPEWYVYPLHALYNYAQGINPGLGWLGSMFVPGIAVAFLILLPLLDRSKDGAAWVKVATALGVVGVAVLAVTGYTMAHPSARAQIQTIAADPKLIPDGKKVFDTSGCVSCHSLGGVGGKVGPALDKVGDRRPEVGWHVAHLMDPKAVSPGSVMPSFDKLTDAQRLALANYLVSLKGGAAAPAPSSTKATTPPNTQSPGPSSARTPPAEKAIAKPAHPAKSK